MEEGQIMAGGYEGYGYMVTSADEMFNQKWTISKDFMIY